MKVKAKKSFAGIVTMHGGETKEIANEPIAESLIACGYVEAVNETVNSEGGKAQNKKAEKENANK